ncbi:3-deoxy-D-manno-octulosonic acid transferase [Pigmentiphaga aceris]|uniref:3-deoxy-D-manno-octulosonic acid transferase n=1 Tax=Pigmentiphaga aceris TaxID=1940612 RepID=A0A5C0B387_9BURK|nr:3-deoxy-D-manno-octulosonic acid transferase [Pigmentiphaga aceris]QEI08374.1 3-deoxy-D-manno-octulosonic acid transferase [Pigmentiphaga aceris]
MSRLLYSLLMRLSAPLLWLRMRRRARQEPSYGAYPKERFALYGDQPAPLVRPVWIHAVSLGETRAAQPLIRAVLDRGLPVLLTHTTATGRAEGGRLFKTEIDSGQLHQAWLPYDMPGAIRRFYGYFAPRCGLLIETEVWPNVVAEAASHNVRLALVSARLSARSARRAARLGTLAKEAFGALDAVLAQTAQDAQRLRDVGARDPQVVGNLKFDIALPVDQIAEGRAWRQALNRQVLAIASTREGEDEGFIAALKRQLPAGGPLVLLIPRHPQRFDNVAAMLTAAGMRVLRRSAMQAGEAVPDDVQVILGDTLGEMPRFYAAADVAIVAGSFAPLGGQNLIEAAACGVPVIVGPHTFNFAQASDDAVEAGAALRVTDAADAIRTALAVLADQAKQTAMRTAAEQFTAAHTGATQRVVDHISAWW